MNPDGRSDVGEYYERRYASTRETAFPRDRTRYRAWFGQLLDPARPPASVLDFGCGVGFVCSELLDAGYETVGVDISRSAVETAAAREPRGTFLHLPAGDPLPFPDSSFDLVTCLGVIEHVPEPASTIAELRRVVRPDGLGIWVVPNSWSPFFWFGRGTEQIEETPRSLGRWRELLAAGGWRVTMARRDPGPLDRPVAGWKRLAQRALNALPLRLTYQFVLQTEPRPAGRSVDEVE